MRPVWVTRDSSTPTEPLSFPESYPVVLLTASRRVHGGEMSEGGYIQGAGDDSEGWSQGLTAPLFWKHKSLLATRTEEELPDLITELLEMKKFVDEDSVVVLIKPTKWLYAASLDAIRGTELGTSDALLTCGEKAQFSSFSGIRHKQIHLECRKGKLGSRDLRKQLTQILPLFTGPDRFEKLFVVCPTGKDLGIGIILAILCLFTNDTGKYDKGQHCDKRQANFL
jgi:tRNA A64-2'-O-ribosylphosphate transferase